MRKGEILSRRWSDIDLDSGNPCLYVRQTKNDEPKRIQLPDMAVAASALCRATVTTNTCFPQRPTRGSKAISKNLMRGILGNGFVEWLNSRASSPCAFMISAISQHQP